MWLCAVPSAWGAFDNQTFYSFTEVGECRVHTEQHTRETSREIRGAWSKNEMGHQITPVIVCTCPIMIDLCKRKQSGVFYLHVKRCCLSLSPSLSPSTIIISNVKCYLGIHNLFLCGEDTIDKRATLCQAPDFFFFFFLVNWKSHLHEEKIKHSFPYMRL